MGKDCLDWMKEGDFKETWVEPLIGPGSIVIGTR